MGQRSVSNNVYVDWFNVTYRSVFTICLLLTLAITSGGGFWYYRNIYQPRADATGAIEEASGEYRKASQFMEIPDVAETVARAGEALDEARTGFDDRRFDDAQFAALHSLDLSRSAIRMAGGQESEVITARFYKLEGDVRVKKAGAFSWEGATPKMSLEAGDQVKTSSRASAQVIYFDGTVTTVEPGSLLEIRELFEDPVTRVRRVREKLAFGEVSASIQKRNTEGSFHEVATDRAAARAEEETEFRVAVDEKKQAQFDVFEGKVLVQGGGRQESLRGGERIRAQADGTLGRRETIPSIPRLRSPADQRVFVFGDTAAARVNLSWEGLPGVDTYHLMISSRPLFTEPLFAGDRRDATASLEGLSAGSYFWKVAAKRDGKKGRYSDVRTFRISSEQIQNVEDTEPPHLEVTDFVAVGSMVIINGRTEPGATLWIDNEKVDVYDDGSYNVVIRLTRDGLNEIAFVSQDNAGNETRRTRSTFVEVY